MCQPPPELEPASQAQTQAIHPDAQRNAAIARIDLRLQAIRQSGLPLILQVTHRMGGGIERHVRELSALLQGRAFVMVLRPGLKKMELRLCFGTASDAEQLAFTLPQDAPLLRRTLLAAGLSRIHVHHLAGFPQPLADLLLGLGRPLDLTLHDYSIIDGSPTLTNQQGLYAGWRCNSHHEFVDPAQAQLMRTLAARAERCLVPSHDMQRRLSLAIPWLQTQVVAHPDREYRAAYPVPSAPALQVGQPLRVMCLGALGREKGVQVLRSVAELARRRAAPLEFTLLGSAHIPVGRAVTSLGAYADDQLPALLAQHQPHLIWFPVLWPETWSYTLSAALEAGVPVLASRLGAFAERLHARPLSWLQAHDGSPEDWLTALLDIREQLRAGASHGSGLAQCWPQQPVPAFYRQAVHYEAAPVPVTLSLPSSIHWQLRHVPAAAQGGAARWRTALLAFGLNIREWPVAGTLLSRIPYNLQRKLKRLLSRAPLR